jgi:hypothetical protein
MSESNTPRRIIPILPQGRVAVAAGNGLEFRHALPLSLYVHIPVVRAEMPVLRLQLARGARRHSRGRVHRGADRRSRVGVAAGLGTQGIEHLLRRRHAEPAFRRSARPAADGDPHRLPLLPDAEITLEANPGTVEADKFAAFRAAGINRLSLGIQSFNPAHLKALGRIHDGDEARRAIEIAAAHFDNFNLDLMYGLPGQTLERGACTTSKQRSPLRRRISPATS